MDEFRCADPRPNEVVHDRTGSATTVDEHGGPVFPDVPALDGFDGQLPTDAVVKNYIFAHYEIGDQFTLGHIVADTGLSEAEAVNGILNAWWWDADTGNPLLMVELVGESPDRYCFVKAPADWLPDDTDD